MDSTQMVVYGFFGVVASLAVAGAIVYAIARRLEKKHGVRFKEE